MGWLSAVSLFQHVQRRISLCPYPHGAQLPAEKEWRRDCPLPLRADVQSQSWFQIYLDDFDAPVVGWLLRYPGRLWLRANPLSTGPSDKLDRAVANAIQTPGAQYDRIAGEGMATPQEGKPGMGRLIKAWRLVSEAQAATAKVTKALRKREIQADSLLQALAPAVEKNIISASDAELIEKAEAARFEAIQVDVFTEEEYYRDQPMTAEPLQKQEATFSKAANA